MPSAEITVQVNDLEFGNFLERIDPNWVPKNVFDLLLDLKAYVESHMRVPDKRYIFTWPDFGSENEDIILGNI
jgi:hypothetical protein